MQNGKIVIKSAHKITKMWCMPVKDKYTGKFISKWVRKVDTNGNPIFLKGDDEKDIFILETDEFLIEDGKIFNLDDEYDFRVWGAIKDSPRIAEKRTSECEFYVDRPEEETRKFNEKIKLRAKALNHVLEDSISGQLQKTRLLGKDMRNSTADEVQKYLLDIADRQPEKVINLYTGGETNLRLLRLDCIEKGIFKQVNEITQYGDEIVGLSESQCINWLSDPKNGKKVEMIQRELYPEMFPSVKKSKAE